MHEYVNGDTIRTLREKQGYTQKQLADVLQVSDKTVSKWETGRGLPDISLLDALCKALQVSMGELFSGEKAENRNRAGNMLRSVWYICPVCGNVLHGMGAASVSCCGVTLPPLEAEASGEDHEITVEVIDGEYYVHLAHPMDKTHFISFVAYITMSSVSLKKLYPEQEAEARFPKTGRGVLLACCNRHGLFSLRI